MAAKLITVYWRDIPAQVIARRGRTNTKAPLSERFHTAIDRAAMRAGKGSSDKYLEEWRRVSRPCGDDIEEVMREEAARLEAAFSDERLETMVKAGGVDPRSED
jgi:hypothetical protein